MGTVRINPDSGLDSQPDLESEHRLTLALALALAARLPDPAPFAAFEIPNPSPYLDENNPVAVVSKVPSPSAKSRFASSRFVALVSEVFRVCLRKASRSRAVGDAGIAAPLTKGAAAAKEDEDCDRLLLLRMRIEDEEGRLLDCTDGLCVLVLLIPGSCPTCPPSSLCEEYDRADDDAEVCIDVEEGKEV